jgi:hypothetical protein
MNFTPPSGQLPQKSGAARPEQGGSRADERATEQVHQSELTRMIADLSRDHAHLRAFIYEYARVKLRKELYPRFVEGSWTEIEEQMRGLEVAIDRIEADFEQKALPLSPHAAISIDSQDPTGRRLPALATNLQRTNSFGAEAIQARSLLLGSPSDPGPAMPTAEDLYAKTPLGRHLRSRLWFGAQLVAASFIGVAIYAFADAHPFVGGLRLTWLSRPHAAATATGTGTADSSKPQQQPVAQVATASKEPAPKVTETPRAPPPDFPIPAEYGAFAVLDGRLTELQQLPIKIPDPRVAISAAISAPSPTHLSNGHVRFVIFRRDLANSAPDRIPVRVLAQVVRALTFDPRGHAKTTAVEQSWVIRSNAYEMRVAPLGDNPEMILIHSDPDFTLPAGRYALVLKGVGYDFTVDGKVTDLAHCLERTDALNTPIYTECQKP